MLVFALVDVAPIQFGDVEQIAVGVLEMGEARRRMAVIYGLRQSGIPDAEAVLQRETGKLLFAWAQVYKHDGW